MDERCLTSVEFRKIQWIIDKYHRFGGLNNADRRVYRNIKYIRPQIDTRSWVIFNIAFDETYFDFRESEETMFERIKKWLDWDEYCEMD